MFTNVDYFFNLILFLDINSGLLQVEPEMWMKKLGILKFNYGVGWGSRQETATNLHGTKNQSGTSDLDDYINTPTNGGLD